METKIKIVTEEYGDMGSDLIHLLHILRDKHPGTYSAIAERMDVKEDALDAMLKELGVPQEKY